MSKPLKSNKSVADEEIIDGLISGDSEALKALYSNHFPLILNMVIRNSGTEDEAKDVFQEAVCVLYDKVQQGGFVLSSKLKTYLFAVSRHLWLKQLKSKDWGTVDIKGMEESIELKGDLQLHQEKEMQFEQMERALEKLGDPCKTILTDFYIHGKSMVEISEKFAYTNADNAKNQKYKCLQRLKKLFFDELS